jgi:hypothetical protein
VKLQPLSISPRFILPAEQIIPTAEETWAFHMTVIRELAMAEQ